MPNSLLTGVSGLIAHQRLLDNVGHNIANMNTHGYKSSRVVFADLLYETIRPASSGSEGDRGGVNPRQIGSGVKVNQIDRKFSQGSLEATGEDLDFAIAGQGFFVVTDGVSDFYTRAGAFSLDAQGFLTAPGGLLVKRFSSVGEPDGVNPGFQIPGESRIRIPIDSPVSAVASREIQVSGNLNGYLKPAIAEQQFTTEPFKVNGNAADGSTPLNQLDSVEPRFNPPDGITISGLDSGGDAISVPPLTVSDQTTLQDLVDFIDGAISDASATLAADGSIMVIADQAGPSSLNFELGHTVGSGGQLELSRHAFVQSKAGAPAESVPEVVTIFDEQGGAHELKLVFEKQDDDEWNMTANIDPESGTIVDGTVESITFNDDGTLRSTSNPVISVQINGMSSPQQISLDFTGASAIETLTHFKADLKPAAVADGAPPGVLLSVQVEQDGTVVGMASNGQRFDVAQLAIASFRNPRGLSAVGDNLYEQSLNSGQPELGPGGGGSRGRIEGGQLESSNVDVALEFTRLIVAQRGFSANARTITVSDEVLEELTNIIR